MARCLCGLQLHLQIGHVVVRITVARSLAKAHAIDDARVVQCITDDAIHFGQQRFEHATVRVEAGGIEDGVFRAVEARQLVLQLLVDVLRAADEAHAAHAVAVRIEGAVRRGDHIGMR